MAVSAARVTAGDTAVALNSAGSAGGRLVIVNTDATNAVDVGGADVTAAGMPIAAGASITVELPPGEVLYAIAATNVELAVLRT